MASTFAAAAPLGEGGKGRTVRADIHAKFFIWNKSFDSMIDNANRNDVVQQWIQFFRVNRSS
jgi:hypothetical protein